MLESKLRIPAAESCPGLVSRAGLVNQLRVERVPVLVLTAPAGFGKTTLLAQWVARDERPTAWVSLDERDNDAATLLRHLVAAFDHVESVDAATLATVAECGDVWARAVPRFTSAVGSCTRPFVFVLDNVDALRRGEAADLVLALAGSLPGDSVLALSGRAPPPLPLARRRAPGGVRERRAAARALARREAQLLVRGLGADAHDARVADLVANADGWAAGLHLAASALLENGGDAGGRLPYVVDYVRSAVLAYMKPARLAFLRRSSILERMSAPLCDAVVGTTGSARELDLLERAGVFVTRGDRAGDWYRYHALFRDVLRAELERDEPELVPALHGRAAEWLEAHGEHAAALEHALAADDVERAARLFATIAMPAWERGEAHALMRWLAAIEARGDVSAHPGVAAVGAWVHAHAGDPREAERLLDAAESAGRRARLPDRTPVRAVVALVRAASGGGVSAMRTAVESARTELRSESSWQAVASLLDGAVALLAGDHETADERFAAAADTGGRRGALATRLIALAERSLLSSAAGDVREAERLALEARDELDESALGNQAPAAIVRASAARALLRHGRWDDARRELAAGETAASALTRAVPWLAVETHLALGDAYVTLRDRAAACNERDAIRAIVEHEPELGAKVGELDDFARRVDDLPGATNGHDSGLTAAELRLIPLLATHLSFREIGDRLFVSRNTIKTQAISAYRKLGVSSRSEAIERAADLGLLS